MDKIIKQIATLLILVVGTITGVAATEIGSYVPSWSAESDFRLMQLDQAGLTDKLTYLNYAFENLYKMPDGTYRCNNGSDLGDHSQGFGMRATLDYAARFGADESVNGVADRVDQPLAGNFNQLKQLKANHPDLKVLAALGGWTWSRWFSAAAATPRLRRVLVSSCIELYIKGNLPVWKGHGGQGSASNVFDGFDIDWEHPGSTGIGYNTASRNDKRNFTLLLAEFRKQLDEQSEINGKRYYLTAAIISSDNNINHTEPAKYASYIDWINLMSYDYHGAWDKNGPTHFQSNLYTDPEDPDENKQSIDEGVKQLMAAGVPSEKIVLGVPFYARGWSGVGAANNGLYQRAEGPAMGVEEGAETYAGMVTKSVTLYYHPITKQLWTYENGVFWTFDDPVVIREKVNYIRQFNLGGIMSWSLDQDDSQFSLTKAMVELHNLK